MFKSQCFVVLKFQKNKQYIQINLKIQNALGLKNLTHHIFDHGSRHGMTQVTAKTRACECLDSDDGKSQ
jgi:hypothetical protein